MNAPIRLLWLVALGWLALAGDDGAELTVPKRPKPIIEWGGDFLGSGPLPPTWELGTGAVWQPQFTLFGSLRLGWTHFSNDSSETQELSARLDLSGNLQLSGTERLVIGLRNFDEDGRFSRYVIEDPSEPAGGRNEFNATIRSLYFEGDLGEIFPTLNQSDRRAWDLGFAVGRMPLVFQDGMLVNDSVDALGVTRNNVFLPGSSNLRLTAIWAWDGVQQAGSSDDDGSFWGVFSSLDTRYSTIDIDASYADHDEFRTFTVAASATQRMARWNTTARLMVSDDRDTESGTLVFLSASTAPRGTHNHLYVNGFTVSGQVLSTSRSPESGGILGSVGISFAGNGLGRYPSPLSGVAEDAWGGALGYQMFFHHARQQVLLELAGRFGDDSTSDALDKEQLALTGRIQTAVATRHVIRLDAFLRRLNGELDAGAAAEWQIQL